MTNTKTTKPAQAEDVVAIPATETIADALGAADAIPDTVRGAQKKKRQAVRARFRSASNKLLMEAAALLGLVKNTWMQGDSVSISVDMTKFNPVGLEPEDIGLFLGFRDAIESAGIKVSTFCLSETGGVAVYGSRVDKTEVPK
jgi:23S rRNA G2069 N7-methylase RlmK/C1962 C5-methylase RlmI